MKTHSKPEKKAVIINDTSYEFHHGCETVVANIKKLLQRQQIQVTATNPVNVNWRHNHSFMGKMVDADLVVVNGEGSIHHAKPRAARLIAAAEYIWQQKGTPVVLINSCCQENGPELTAKMKFFTRIYVRESFSQRDLENSSISSQVVPDMSFYTQYDLNAKKNTERIGVTDSVYPEISEYLYDLSQRKDYLYLPILTNVRLHKNNSNLLQSIRYQTVKKLDFIRFKAGHKLKHKKIKRFFYLKNYQKYIQAIADLNFLFTGRFHSLCFALKTMTPFAAIPSNSHKMESLLHDIGLESNRLHHVSKLENLSNSDFSPTEQEKIRDYVTSAPARIEQMFAEIRELI